MVNNILKQAIISALPLLSKKATLLARTWLLEQRNGFTRFYPATQALDIAFNLPIGSQERLTIQKAILDRFHEETNSPFSDILNHFFNAIDAPVNSDTTNELAGVISDIVDNAEESSKYISSDLAEDIINNFVDGDDLSFCKEVFALICKDSSNIKVFEAFEAKVGKDLPVKKLLSVFMYCITEDEPTIIKELLASSEYTLEASGYKELADDLSLESLSFFSDDTMFSGEKFDCTEAPVDEDDIIEAIIKTFDDINDDQVNLMISKLDHNTMLDIEDDEFSECVTLINNSVTLVEGLDNEQKASFIYFCLVHEDLFDLKDEMERLHTRAQEEGADNEAADAISQHSVFSLDEKYSYNDDGSLIVKFNSLKLFKEVVLQDCSIDFFEYENNFLQNFTNLDEIMRHMIFSNDSDFKANDLNVPHYGFFGYDEEYFFDSLSDFLSEKQIFTPLQLAA
jgi:hypothetical protein